jgi:hypothetical protein
MTLKNAPAIEQMPLMVDDAVKVWETPGITGISSAHPIL